MARYLTERRMPFKKPTTPQSLSKRALKAHLTEVKAELAAVSAQLELLRRPASTPDKMTCPITYARMRSPVVCADGHIFERSALEKWMTTHTTNPATGMRLAHRHLNPALQLRNEIIEFEEATQRCRPPPSPTPRRVTDPLPGGLHLDHGIDWQEGLHGAIGQVMQERVLAEQTARREAQRQAELRVRAEEEARAQAEAEYQRLRAEQEARARARAEEARQQEAQREALRLARQANPAAARRARVTEAVALRQLNIDLAQAQVQASLTDKQGKAARNAERRAQRNGRR